MTLLLVLLGGAVGASCRFLADAAIRAYVAPNAVFPWGTAVVNVVGSFGLGVLVGFGHHVPDWISPLLVTGLFGALTTYSTFSVETLRLVAGGAKPIALANVLATVLLGLAAGWLGLALAR